MHPYPGDITRVHGIRVGHAQSERGKTGCTVVLCRKEGAVGGVIGGVGTCVALYYVFKLHFGLSSHITLPFVIITALCLAVLSIFGDLAASTIKRHHGVKDFGNLLPGHGGVMDRFDSSVFVFAALYGVITVAARFM